MRKFFLFVLIVFALFLLPGFAQTSSGGIFEITQSVIATGGENLSNGNVSIDSTIGQSIGGDTASGNIFSVESGFWNVPEFAPTAANASISGRTLTAQGGGIRNVLITLTEISSGAIRSVRSSDFGYFRFENVPTGETYILTLHSKNFVFLPNSRVLMLFDDLTDVNFTAEPQN